MQLVSVAWDAMLMMVEHGVVSRSMGSMVVAVGWPYGQVTMTVVMGTGMAKAGEGLGNVSIVGSVKTWASMRTMFYDKFFSAEEKATLVDLGRERQRLKEDLIVYIQFFRDRAMEVQDALEEKELIKLCIHEMFLEYHIHLENLCLFYFSTLIDATRKT